MVKLILSFVAIAAMAATVTTAAPFTLQSMRHFFNPAVHNECIPETTIKEYHPFNLKSWKLNSLVSKEINDNVIVGGVNGDQNLQQLEMCIVSSDYGCNADIPSNCIYENVEYRIRVQGPVQGYLRIVGDLIEIVEDFHSASGLNLYKEAGWGLRIARLNYDGSRSVFATNGGGNPLTVEPPRKDDGRQWFQIVEPSSYAVRAPRVQKNDCIPETTIKEYHPFNLKSSRLNSLVSKEVDDNVIVGGINGDQTLQQLEMCIVSSDYGCNANIPSNCIYENVEYRVRVQEPVQGYLRIVGDLIEIVEDFHGASGLNLYKEEGWGLRIARLNYDGSRSVFATNGGGNPLTMEPPRKDDSRQWFQIIEPQLRSRWYRSRRQ